MVKNTFVTLPFFGAFREIVLCRNYRALVGNRVARWYIYQTQNPNLEKFWNFGMETVGMYILWPFGIPTLWPFGTFYGHLEIWNTLLPFGTFHGPLVI
jgi:hypothetical protein